ncbi:hypothetical protein VTK73DRAFT_543 [Phialemonium thermophilum]|uniref:Autophagy-related protein 14 n=1 Tax=Phialemonium thermophilum TaxID=223376 RepID=A0ABR3XE62_9PEZI
MATESPRPVLLPQNRKLRHLRGIYLRNLRFSRPRGRTIDDAAINKSPSKLETLRDTHQLHHSLSTEDLRSPPADRKWTNNLSNTVLSLRQRTTESATGEGLADAFFSLHCEGEEDPIYISEVSQRATNFNFRFFELTQLDASITRLPRVTVKVWTKRHETWSLLLEENVDLRFLNFLGTMLNVHFPPNSLVFHLTDGIYSLELSSKPPPPKQATPLPTASYNALMRLATLDHSIQDALQTSEAIARQINEILARTPRNEAPQVEDRVQLAKKYVLQQQRAVQAAERRKRELQESIAARRDAIRSGREAQERAAVDVDDARLKLSASQELLLSTRESIHGQRRRICEDLSRIYNIVPVPMGPPLSFQICGVPLPNTSYDESLTSGSATEDSLSAALGYVAQLTNALQYYLSVPLPYPVYLFGSRSSIRDDISILSDPQREFPLYLPRGGSRAQFRFDYGWFLLNKDIEVLCTAQGLKVVDIRHTLPNLKYLLYVCSAGSDELPERKRGGVRGLWAGKLKSKGLGIGDDDTSSLAGSRPGSADSDRRARQRGELTKTFENQAVGAARVATAEDLLSSTPASSVASHLDGETKLSLRTKGLRERAVK